MQIPADPLDAAALDAALLPGQRQYFRHVLQVDWNRDGNYSHSLSDLSSAVSTAKISRELDDSTPGSAMVASGASAAKLDVTLNGSKLVGGFFEPISELLAPYNSASPLYRVKLAGTPIRWKIQTSTTRGWITTDQCTAWIDDRGVRRAANTVEFTAIDIPPKLRDPTFWPPYAVDGPAAARLNSYAPQRGLASSVVDYVFNAAGLRTRPRPPWESHPSAAIALCWLPMCGSFAPAAGKQISQHPWGNFQLFPAVYPISPGWHPQGTYWVTGQWGLARHGEANVYPGSLIYTTRDDQPTWAAHTSSVSAWVYCGPGVSGYDGTPASSVRPQVAAVHFGYAITTNYYAYRVSIGTAGPTVQLQVEAGTDRHYFATYTPGTDAWRHVHVQLDNSVSPAVAKLFVDGTQQASISITGTSNSIVATALNVLFLPQVGFHLRPGVPMSDAMAWQENGAPTITPERTVFGGIGATVARSLNEITHLGSPGDPAWEVAKDIAAVEFAALMTDEQGLVHWRNRDTIRSTEDPQTITLAYPSEVGTLDSEDGHANAALVSARPGEASWQKAWDLPAIDAIIAVPGVTEWIFPLDDDVIAIESGTVPPLMQSAASASPVPVWSGSANTGYVFVYDGTETEELVDQNMVLLTDQSGLGDKQLMRIVITNSSTSAGRFRLKDDNTAGTDPQPALKIAGLVLAQSPVENDTVYSDANVTADGVVRTINLTGGEWRQHLDSVRDSAYFALRRTTQRIPVFDRFQVPGDPRRQIADNVILKLGASGPRVRGFIVGITRTLTDKGLAEDLTIRATHAPGLWALEDTVLGVLESTAIVG